MTKKQHDPNVPDDIQTIVAVDFSITSPCICIFDRQFEPKFSDCQFLFTTTKKRQAGKIYKNWIKGVFLDRDSMSGDPEYFHSIASTLCHEILHHPKPIVFIENYAFSRSGKVFNIAEATGIFKYQCFLRHIPCHQYIPPTAIKKEVVGSGRAGKEDGYAKFQELSNGFPLKAYTKETEKSVTPSSDIIDSFFLARYLKQKNIV